MFSTKGVEESKEFVSQYIKPGVGEYKITGVEATESQTGTPAIKLSIESRPLAELQNAPQKGDFTIYFSDKSRNIALNVIQELGKANGFTKEQLDEVSGANLHEYVSKIKSYLTKDFIRIKFKGEEVMNNSNGKVWIKAVLPAYNFAQPLTVENSLTFVSVTDIKKLPVADLDTTSSADDDLPF